MLRRLLSLATLLALAATTSLAAPRSRQIPVSGTALATFFSSQGQAINVSTDQLDLQTLSVAVGTAFEVHRFGSEASGTDVGAYNANGNSAYSNVVHYQP